MLDKWKPEKQIGIGFGAVLLSIGFALAGFPIYSSAIAANFNEQNAPLAHAASSSLGRSTTRAQAATSVAYPSPHTVSASVAPNYQIFRLQDEIGNPVRPSAIVQCGDSLFMLGEDCLWHLPGAVGSGDKEPKPLVLKKLPVPGNKVKGIPIQEFLAACYYPLHKSIVILDKSGSLFEYLPERGNWHLFRANKQTLGTPDPHYVSIASDGTHILLLDPERNQIWRFPSARSDERYFREVLPWRIKAGDPNVSDGVGLAFDGNTLVLRRSGNITVYPSNSHGGNGSPRRLNFKAPHSVSPTRLSASTQGPLYIIERENNRVLVVDKKSGTTSQFLFPASSDLRGIMPGYGGFAVIDGDSLVFRMLKDADAPSAKIHPRSIDHRLKVLKSPVKGASIPRHPGVFPGARRLYRHGVHQGLDFFHDPGSGAHVAVNTPAVASAAGRVIRADVNYRDMDPKQYSHIMSQCAHEQYCSDANEDLFRGCQVWIDHGNGLITRYAHLNKARPDLRVGMHVAQGEQVGYIGYSGTGENIPSRGKHPHLHFEIWLDGHYLGHGLTPSETIALYQKLFK